MRPGNLKGINGLGQIQGQSQSYGPVVNENGQTFLYCAQYKDDYDITCGAGFPIADATFVDNTNPDGTRQSSGKCDKGTHWEITDGKLSIPARSKNSKCRGKFNVTPASGPVKDTDIIDCRSEKHRRYQECRSVFPIGYAEVIEQFGKPRCEYDKTWGFTQDGALWVNDYCRAKFLARPPEAVSRQLPESVPVPEPEPSPEEYIPAPVEFTEPAIDPALLQERESGSTLPLILGGLVIVGGLGFLVYKFKP